MQAAVIPRDQIPHEKLILIPATSHREASYVAALLNSSPANLLLQGAAVRVQTKEFAPSDVSHLRIPAFDRANPVHAELSRLSMESHAAAAEGDAERIVRLEREIDTTAARPWEITDVELGAIQNALAETDKSGRRVSSTFAAEDGD
jgi:hypothetical protein